MGLPEDADNPHRKTEDKALYCSFCGKSQHEVRKLIAGPTVFICDECVELCMDIIKEEFKVDGLHAEDRYPELFGVEIPKQFHSGKDALRADTIFPKSVKWGAVSPEHAMKAIGKTMLRVCNDKILEVVDSDIAAVTSTLDSAEAALRGYLSGDSK